jgi:hypothetical protein
VIHGVVRVRQGQGAKLQPMAKWSALRRKAQNRLQQSRTSQKFRRQKSELKWGSAHGSSQTRPSGFSRFRIEEDFEDHRAWDGTNTSLVSTWTHAQPEEEDSEDESAEAERRGDREGKRQALQRYSTDDPDEARVEGKGED